ncbi:MAG: hypothetical protein ABEI58_03080 [Candidatus Nanohaloarchaea archaeon]
MDVFPPVERFDQSVEAALQNLDVLGAEVSPPSRVIFGYVPTVHEQGFSSAAGMYSSDADTAFISAGTVAVLEEDPRKPVITVEHELIHAEQLNRYLGRPGDDFLDRVQLFEEEAEAAAVELFSDHDFIEAYIDGGRVSSCNFKRLAALLSGQEDVVEEIYGIYQEKKGRAEDLLRRQREIRDTEKSEVSPGRYEEMKKGLLEGMELADNNFGFIPEVDTYVEENWDRIRDAESLEFLEPVFSRHEPGMRDDFLEAQAQFWTLFRHEALDDLPREGYHPRLEEALENIDRDYTGHPLYEYGGNVRNMTEVLIDEYRMLRDAGAVSEPEAAAKVLNRGLEYWDASSPTSQGSAV